MFITCVFKVIISKSLKASMAEQTFIIALETVSDRICAEFALLGCLVEEEVVMAFKTVGIVV